MPSVIYLSQLQRANLVALKHIAAGPYQVEPLQAQSQLGNHRPNQYQAQDHSDRGYPGRRVAMAGFHVYLKLCGDGYVLIDHRLCIRERGVYSLRGSRDLGPLR